jgi:hypothetical protein
VKPQIFARSLYQICPNATVQGADYVDTSLRARLAEHEHREMRSGGEEYTTVAPSQSRMLLRAESSFKFMYAVEGTNLVMRPLTPQVVGTRHFVTMTCSSHEQALCPLALAAAIGRRHGGSPRDVLENLMAQLLLISIVSKCSGENKILRLWSHCIRSIDHTSSLAQPASLPVDRQSAFCHPSRSCLRSPLCF